MKKKEYVNYKQIKLNHAYSEDGYFLSKFFSTSNHWITNTLNKLNSFLRILNGKDNLFQICNYLKKTGEKQTIFISI